MSHGDAGAAGARGFDVLASTEVTPVAAFGSPEQQDVYGVQWHPEVKHSDHGQEILKNFLHTVCGYPRTTGTAATLSTSRSSAIRAQVGYARVISALSGGVDSAVSTALVHEGIGDQLTAVFVDHGLLRKGEREQVENDYVASTGVRLHHR